ncbi:MAG TPA: phosphotransferase [Bacillales bacterium]
MSTKALACFPKGISREIKPLLEAVKERSRQIFQPLCWISGDPNPTNWGIRNTGKLVLFDWERAGYGHPAIDLAITMPGLGTSDHSLESLIAKRYLDLWRGADLEVPFTEQELTREINTAKIWSTVEFLANHSKLLDSQTIRAFVEQFPAKLVQFQSK